MRRGRDCARGPQVPFKGTVPSIFRCAGSKISTKSWEGLRMSTAAQPFQFATAAYLTRIENQRATTIKELLEGVQNASDGAIFYHTFQTLGQHHFLTEGFSNDFAQWVLAALNHAELAERLASIDIRDYVSIAEL